MKCQACIKEATTRKWIKPFSASKIEVTLCDECNRMGGVRVFEKIAAKNKDNVKYK